jgi:cob(I)alamin adenosyltransferase
MNRARVLVFTGPGKGKTTAALGMALRTCGHGMRVLVIQFVKSDASTGEIQAAALLPLLKIEQYGLGFLPPPSSPEFAAHRAAAERGLERARKAVASEQYALIVLDEICAAVRHSLLPEEAVCALVASAPASCVLALTGRDASEKLQALADTVTEMRCVKHGLQAGRPAQKGVER